MNKIIKIFLEIFSWIFIGFFIILISLTIISNTNFIGGYRSFLVQSGSMEPSIMTGDIIIINKQKQYFKNDVITFQNEKNGIVTHRILNIEKNKFITKGDANRTSDPEEITQDIILGKVIITIPKLGYLVAFTKTLPGLILLIIIPVIILISDEFLKMFKTIKNKNSDQQKN
ncbi:MAG: signal peptidase I [Candidatus Shapirobacteria bacterium]|jgi:signal peptidase